MRVLERERKVFNVLVSKLISGFRTRAYVSGFRAVLECKVEVYIVCIHVRCEKIRCLLGRLNWSVVFRIFLQCFYCCAGLL